jgi:hypothetical protein
MACRYSVVDPYLPSSIVDAANLADAWLSAVNITTVGESEKMSWDAQAVRKPLEYIKGRNSPDSAF